MSTTRKRRIGRRKVKDDMMMVVEDVVAGGDGDANNTTDAADLERDVESLYGWIKYVSRRQDVDRSKSMMQIVTDLEKSTKKKMALCEEYTSDLAELADVAKDWDILVTGRLFELCMADPAKAKAVGAPKLLVQVAEAGGGSLTEEDDAMQIALDKVFPNAEEDDYDDWVVRAYATLYVVNGHPKK